MIDKLEEINNRGNACSYLTGLELTLYPKTNIKSMPKERKKELVSTILCSFAGLNPGDESCEVQVEAHFMSEKKYIVDGE